MASAGRTLTQEKTSGFGPRDVRENLCVLLLMLPSANRETRDLLSHGEEHAARRAAEHRAEEERAARQEEAAARRAAEARVAELEALLREGR